MAKIKIYRGITANTQEELDRYISEFMASGEAGTHGGGHNYGIGDYFSADKGVAEKYTLGKKFSHIFEFEIDDRLFLDPGGRDKEYQYTNDYDLTEIAKEKGLLGVNPVYSDIFVVTDHAGFLKAASGKPTQQQKEAKVSKELAAFYRKYLTDVKAQLQTWLENYNDLSFSKRLEVERLMNVSNTVKELLGEPTDSIAETIKNYVATEGKDGYNTVWYGLENAHNITLQMPFIDGNYIKAVMDNPVAGKTLSKRLYKHRDDLAKKTVDAISRGFLMGYGYDQIAGEIARETEANYNRSVVIARTEGGRLRSIATQKGYENASKLGVDLDKRWMATYDMRTRHDHALLDGQTVAIDSKFKINGLEGAGPRLFGSATEDINCRCTTISVVFGVAPETRLDNEDHVDTKWITYDEWLKDKHPEEWKSRADLAAAHADLVKTMKGK